MLEELDGDYEGLEQEEDLGTEGDPLEEHEVREVMNTMLQKRTFSQSMKLKKAKELARGFGGWKGSGRIKENKGKVEQLNWHRECPDGKTKGKGQLHGDHALRDFRRSALLRTAGNRRTRRARTEGDLWRPIPPFG